MRLEGKLAIITGGSGGIGKVVAKRYLEEGAVVIITGRSEEKLIETCEDLKRFKEKLNYLVMDGADIDSVKMGVDHIRRHFGKIDILINNAGSAGPMKELSQIPITDEDVKRLQEEGVSVKESLTDAVGSLLGGPWLVTCALLPLLKAGGSIVNVSTIFSKTDYFGRAAYVAPKAALNELSQLMAEEFGQEPYSIRVNTLYPGPVESERIHTVFDAMDQLKQIESGTTGKKITSEMTLQPPTFLSKEEIANTMLFLGSDESCGFTAHEFEVTHGLKHPEIDRIEIFSAPNPKTVNLNGHYTWIIGGDQLDEACLIAQKHYDQGSKILLTFRNSSTVKKAEKQIGDQLNFAIKTFDPMNQKDWKSFIREFKMTLHYPNNTLIFPRYGAKEFIEKYGDSVLHIPLEAINDFLREEIIETITIAHWISKVYESKYSNFRYNPMVLFISNKSDRLGDKFARIRSAAIHQVIRTWKHEILFIPEVEKLSQARVHQLIRYENKERENLEFTANVALSISAGVTSFPHIDLTISKAIHDVTPELYCNQKFHQLIGNLDGKIALVTGGSEGIGRETSRLLAQGGAYVVIASRSEEKLEKTKKYLIREVELCGFSLPESRIFALTCDVTDEKSVEALFNQVIALFGRIDYLINNAGIAGEEQLVFDMSVEGWRKTLQANIISNYHLMIRSLPYMEKQRSGCIVNLSSKFGGQSFGTPSYPNRSDYAVTKTGQRAFAEAFNTVLGPNIKINAISPGPVEGDRLRGGAHRPGLYLRRAYLNVKNKRIKLIYEAVLECIRQGEAIEVLLEIISLNEIQSILQNESLVAPIQKITRKILDTKTKFKHPSEGYLLKKSMANRLLDRLELAHRLPKDFSRENFFKNFKEPDKPFFSEDSLIESASLIKSRAIDTLALGHMPSEFDVGREIVLSLSNKSITGETLHPSCGMNLERMQTPGKYIGNFHPSFMDRIKVETVMIIGDSMVDEMAKIALAYSEVRNTKKIIIRVESKSTIKELKSLIGEMNDKITIQSSTINELFEEYGLPDVMISIPLGALPIGEGEWDALPNLDAFKKIIEENLTNHFKVARRGGLIDDCRVFFVTPNVPSKGTDLEKAFSKFIQITLSSLTVTAGQESLRTSHRAKFYQINFGSSPDHEKLKVKLIEALLELSLPEVNKDSDFGQIIRL